MGELKRDCKFYSAKKKDCTALKMLYCQKEQKPCAFYKSDERYEAIQKEGDKK